jgi:hypothetical protein
MPVCKMLHVFMRLILYGCDERVFNQEHVIDSQGEMTFMVPAQREWDALTD